MKIMVYGISEKIEKKLREFARERGLTLSSAVKTILAQYFSERERR